MKLPDWSHVNDHDLGKYGLLGLVGLFGLLGLRNKEGQISGPPKDWKR